MAFAIRRRDLRVVRPSPDRHKHEVVRPIEIKLTAIIANRNCKTQLICHGEAAAF
jgi:hypothetical protein